MELRVLKYFVTVAQEGSFTKAAERLHVTQPVLSRQIMLLEEELDTKLLHRGKRQVTMTEEGRLLKRRAEDLLELAGRTKRELVDMKQELSGEIVIGTAESSAQKVIPDIVESFQKKYPNVRYHFIAGTADQIEEKMENGIIDLGLLLEPIKVEGYEYIRLPFPERNGVFMRADDPLASREGLSIKEIKSLPLIVPNRKAMQDYIGNILHTPLDRLNVIATVNLISNAAFFVEKGMGYGITIEGAVLNYDPNRFQFVPIIPESYTNSVLIWKKQKTFNPVVTKFLEHIIMLFEHDE